MTGLAAAGSSVASSPDPSNVLELQQWLIGHGQAIVADGKAGPATRQAILDAFANRSAPAVTQAEIDATAARIGCSSKQVAAIATVESAGGGFLDSGRPKILFERHYFWRLTEGRFGVTEYSNSARGGYGVDSWQKLALAACKDPRSAFQSASWGKFQIMGAHWNTLGYPSPIAMAYSFAQSEAAHYDALARFIVANRLQDEAKALSTDPEACRAFARAYNGKAYEDNAYHVKLARAMR